MMDETERLKAEEKERMGREWIWADDQPYESITIDDLKEEESELMTIQQEDVEQNAWGWGRLGIIIAAVVGFSVIADANVIGLLGRYWWLVFIVIAWRNQNYRFSSWPTFVLGFFMWGILVGNLGLAPIWALLGMGAVATFLSRRN